MARERKYIDLDLDFVAHPNTGDVTRITNTNAVIRAFRNLVYTYYYEAPFQPQKGNWLARALFENDDEFTKIQVVEEVKNLANNWEPRVSDVEVEVSTPQSGSNPNTLRVDISFKVIGTLNPVTFTIVLEKTR